MRNLFARVTVAFLVLVPFCGCAQSLQTYTAIVEQSGAVVCSEDTSVSCELSAVAWVRNDSHSYLVFGNDKPQKPAGESSIFSMPFSEGVFRESGGRSYYSFSPFTQARKIESMSVTPDGQYVVTATALDRHNDADSTLDVFNMVIAWPSEAPNKATVLASSQRDGIESSRLVRDRLASAIQKKFGQNSTYFKMEGLALLPNHRVLFGIREIGQSNATFDYRVVLVEGRYDIQNGKFALDESSELKVVRDFSDVTSFVGHKVGLSSIEYDVANQRLFLVTSFEDNEEKSLGAYLWVLPDTDGYLGTSLSLVRTSDGSPFQFPHKAEGLAVLGDGRVFIVHDDDRNVTNIRVGGTGVGQLRARKPNESAFDILRVCSPEDASACAVQY
jgi:hypothetical protein